MELWIRSQDKTTLSKFDLLILEKVESGYMFIADHYKNMGVYKTKERALEVLDEIQKLLEPKIEYTPIIDEDLKPEYTYKHYEQIGFEKSVMELNTYVYQMPEE